MGPVNSRLEPSTPKKNVLRVGTLSPIRDLDPWESRDFVSGMVQWQVFETPYAPPFADDPPEPVIFEERLHDDSGDGMVLSAAVRSGVRFSDGTAMTPHHVVDSLRRARVLVEQANVEAHGPRVAFKLRRRNARFEMTLTQRFCAVVIEKGKQLVGTGPYVVAPDAMPESFHLVRNPHYRRPVAIEEIVFASYAPDADGRPGTLLEAMRKGEVDFTRALSRGDLAELRGVRKWFEPGTSTAILYFNAERTIIHNPVVRKALALTLSRSQLTKICYSNPLAFTASGLLPPMMGRWRDGLRHDLDRAQELLEQPGVARPKVLSLLVIWGPRPYLPEPAAVAETIAGQLRGLEIEVQIVVARDKADYYGKLCRGQYDMVLAGWIADTPDPADFLESILSSHLIPQAGKQMANRANLSRWRSRDMDAALAAYRGDPSLDNRGRILQILSREVPLLPLMYGPTTVAHSWRVKNFRLSPLGLPFFSTMELQ